MLYNIIIRLILGGKMARVLISMPEEFLSKIDKLASTEQRTRRNWLEKHCAVTSKDEYSQSSKSNS
jgi:metal-responsive CopG/Arc/MetJ family transcriptional regulator